MFFAVLGDEIPRFPKGEECVLFSNFFPIFVGCERKGCLVLVTDGFFIC